MAKPNEIIEFYKRRYASVRTVKCDKCGTLLAVEVKPRPNEHGLKIDRRGVAVIPVDDSLLSSRVRLDERPDGQPMMGYQCGAKLPNPEYPKHKAEVDKHNTRVEKIRARLEKDPDAELTDEERSLQPRSITVPEFVLCLNDTRLSRAEKNHPPRNGWLTPLQPHEEHEVRTSIKLSGIKPDFESKGNQRRYESFLQEVL